MSGAPLIPTDRHGTPVYDRHPLFNRIIWAYGFRSFFLASAGYAVISVLIWAAYWAGFWDIPEAIPALEWHAHEMIFGVLGAAIAGFLLTAVPEWTGFPPRIGRSLAALFGLWLLGRLGMWGADILPVWLVGSVNVGFFLLVAIWVTPCLWQDPNRRHRSFIWLMPLLGMAQLVCFADWMGWQGLSNGPEDPARRAINAGLHIYLIAIVLTVTRISMVLVPLALEEQNDSESLFRPIPPRRNLATATLILFALADFIAPQNAVTGWITLAAAAAQFDRMTDWHVGRVLLKPYVLMLYLTYLWLALGLAALGLDTLFFGQAALEARHALTMGAAGHALLLVFIVAGLRHTGRELVIPNPALVAVGLISLATTLRVLTPYVCPDYYAGISVIAASVFWAAAFAAYLFAFIPILTAPRRDGVAG